MQRRAKFESKDAAVNARGILMRQGWFVFLMFDDELYTVKWF